MKMAAAAAFNQSNKHCKGQMMKIKAVVTDIEGTTSNIEFVHQVLFPYSKEHLPAFVTAHWTDLEIRPYLAQVEQEVGSTEPDAVIGKLLQWVEQDVKATPLKALQGKIWKQAFEEKLFTSHVYADAYTHIKGWYEGGIPVYVFSSGSVDAQIGIFGHTVEGDMTPFLRGYFDTEIGAKREPGAYRHIIESTACEAGAVLFLSDVVQELDAAAEVGMQTCLLIRGDSPDNADRHPSVSSFDELDAIFEF